MSGVAARDVPLWWVRGGIGHVVLATAQCPCCPPVQSLCGLEGGDRGGRDLTPEMPARPCPDCLRRLGSPSIRRADYVAHEMRTVSEVPGDGDALDVRPPRRPRR